MINCRPPWGAWFAAAYLATCHSLIGHHGIRVVLLKANLGSTRVIMESDKNHFWLLFEGEKPAAWRRLFGRWRSAFGRLQSSGAGRRLSLQIWLEGQIREKKSWVTEEKKRKIFWGVLEFEGWSRESFWRKQREREGKRVKRGKFSGSLRRLQRRKLWEREGLGLNYEGKCELLGA